MKVYFFESGTLKSKKHFFTNGLGVGQDFEVPVPFFLIDHPRGKVLFDTGCALEVVDTPLEHWGQAMMDAYNPAMTKEQHCVSAVKSLGIAPEDIKYVILSHLHLDHAGGVGQFPNATYIVQKEEFNYAYAPDSFMHAAYIRKDFDRPVKWHFLNGFADDMFDLFGDGTVVTYYTPGHTPGHMSLMLNLPKSGKMFFTADSCYTLENLDGIMSGLACSNSDVEKTIKRICLLRDAGGADIVVGHDPEKWKSYKKAPDFYE